MMEHKAEEKVNWAKALVDKYKNQDKQKNLMQQHQVRAEAMTAYNKRVDDYLAKRLFKKVRKKVQVNPFPATD